MTQWRAIEERTTQVGTTKCSVAGDVCSTLKRPVVSRERRCPAAGMRMALGSDIALYGNVAPCLTGVRVSKDRGTKSVKEDTHTPARYYLAKLSTRAVRAAPELPAYAVPNT